MHAVRGHEKLAVGALSAARGRQDEVLSALAGVIDELVWMR
jgi:hypothetical protein